ncbi:MAG: hypothetical protein HYU66_08210 [Armatimonadetes bacterium]|nr:hypothetical protein [Armatimonadota bacterium]
MPLPDLDFARFYDHAAITDFLTALAETRPELVCVHPITSTPEARPLLVAEITDPATGPAADKPGYLVHANIHAHELTTTHSALHLARTLCVPGEAVDALLRKVAFYVIPRLNPDGAEQALKTNASVRSRSYEREEPNGLVQRDLDGDGQVLWMRWLDPDGDHAPHPDDPRLMIRREPEDQGPFYRLVPEGEVRGADGRTPWLSDRRIDWNRQWPAFWQPEHVQGGAGDFPFSEPEMHAVGRWVMDHPNLFGMMGLHTGGNGVLRPSATRDDSELDSGDVTLLREVGAKGAELTGFPLFSVRQYCTSYSSDAKLWGHFTDWSYEHLGVLSFEIELGNLYNSAGQSTEDARTATPRQRDLAQIDVIRWNDEHGYGAFVDWRPFDHPQLGPVELGGWVRYRLANPALGELPKICEGTDAFMLHHAGLAPHLELRTDVASFDGGVHRVRAEVVNTGALPTQVTNQGAKLRSVRGVRVSLEPGEGMELLSRVAVHDVGHLAKVCGKREVEWFVRGGGEVRVTAGCARAGVAEVDGVRLL